MSDLWIAANPRIDEPSNMTPSVKKSSGSVAAGTLKCCCWPGRSVKRTSTNSTFSFLMKLRTSSELVNIRPPLRRVMAAKLCFGGCRPVSRMFPGRFVPPSGASVLPPDDGGVGQSVVHAPVVPVEDQGGDEQREQRGAADRSQRVDGDVVRDPDDPQAEQMHAEGPAGDEQADDVVQRERDEAPCAGQALGEAVRAGLVHEQRGDEAGGDGADQERAEPRAG